MKSNIIKLGLLAAVVYGFYAFTIGKTLTKLEIYINGVGRLKFRDGLMYLYIDMALENPNKQEVTINDLYFDIFQNGSPVGKVRKHDINVKVSGRSRKNIKNIEARVNLISLASNIIKLFSSQSTKQEFTVTGYLTAGNLKIPVNQQITASE